MLTSVKTIIQSLNNDYKVSIAYSRGHVGLGLCSKRHVSQIRNLYAQYIYMISENTHSVPVPLILRREYILIKTMMMAMAASVQTIASSDPPLSWSPPIGTGSEAIAILALLRWKAQGNRRNRYARGKEYGSESAYR